MAFGRAIHPGPGLVDPMARLSKIRIAGWKSIRDMDPGLELGPLNVLIGANGSGKSNLVSFFQLLNELEGERLQTYIGQSGGADSVLYLGSKVTPRISAELEAETETGRLRYSFHLTYAAPGALLIDAERIVPDGPSPKAVSISTGGHLESHLRQQAAQCDQNAKTMSDLFKRFRVYHFHDTAQTARIRQAGYIEANQGLYSDAGNLAAMLYLYQQTRPWFYDRIVRTVRKVMPMLDDFVLEPQRLNPRNILLNWKQQGSNYIFGPHQISDSSLRAMALITLFLQPAEDMPALIVVDEPELGIHPHVIEIIAGLIRAASLTSQVILTTQSSTFLDHFEPGEIIVVDSRNGRSLFHHLNTKKLRYWLKDHSAGQLWEMNVLGGGPLP
jgi:predicted ATPase